MIETQNLCRKSGNGICINCNNPDNLLCKKDVEFIVEMLRIIVSEIPKEEVMETLSMDSESEYNLIMGIV